MITARKTKHKYKNVDGINIFYREAGEQNDKALVMLHGFPTSSHMYRKLFDQLSDNYHLIAPDYPGYGESDFPSPDLFKYTFDNLASVIDKFLDSIGLEKYTLMIQDYGAPIGFRIATRHPDRIEGLVIQNGNTYEEGLGNAWEGIRKLWKDRSAENEESLLPAFTIAGLKWQYTHGTRNPESINPDCWILDYNRLSRPESHRANLDLFYDYQNNLKLYPEWQKYLREYQPATLIVWGKNDEFFPESGAHAYKKDLNNPEIFIYDTGHFALEEDGDDIISKIDSFM